MFSLRTRTRSRVSIRQRQWLYWLKRLKSKQKSLLGFFSLVILASFFLGLPFGFLSSGTLSALHHSPSTPTERSTYLEDSDDSHNLSTILVLPDRSYLKQISLCALSRPFTRILVVVPTYPIHFIVEKHLDCDISVELLSTASADLDRIVSLSRLLDRHKPSVVLRCFENATDIFLDSFRQFPFVQIHCSQLAATKWIGLLNDLELQNWRQPRIQLVVITNDRPRSLQRLLDSLRNAQYFGDKVDLLISIEQTADLDTLVILRDFQWPHGHVHLRHRVVMGGLLPAVVESWYPSDNDTYGVLLEDDVEVSSMFYAWVKMMVLHYRYGRRLNRSPQLFGISLYQQRTSELHIAGRRNLDVPEILEAHGLEKHTPYLSPVPCSWGAVYFPEHWREFHDFLVLRLSESTHDVSENIVPDVRSNTWRRSWKRYFIELVYLRGYVMLYPNFPDYASLSTNHLELGAHVKELPENRQEEKRKIFTVPLVGANEFNEACLLAGRHQRLPMWSELPVLDLFGALTNESDLADVGAKRRLQTFDCEFPDDTPRIFDARQLLCIDSVERDIEFDDPIGL